jgi:hypothetical protein
VLAITLFLSIDVRAQAYFDIPVQLDFYRTNSDELNYSRRGVVINPSVGMVLAGNDSSKFEGHLAVGLFISKFDQKVGSETFEFQSIGLLQTSFTGYYNFSKRIQAGVGLHFGWYGVSEKKLNLKFSSEKYSDRLGKGYNTINFGNSVDFRFHVDPVLSIGAKFTYWYLPQLEYMKIGDYGDFTDTQKDLYLTRLEFSIRIYTRKREYLRR